MSVWVAKSAVIAASLVMVAIRAPHGLRSQSVKVTTDRKGPLEKALLTLAWMGFFIPLIWVFSSVFAFAEYGLRPAPLVAGVAGLAAGLWLFHASHASLGTNWSISLQMREGHRLVTDGLYRHVRHPMYVALIVYGIGQALVVPNWIVGPSYLVTFGILFMLRVRAEEQMMLDEFGDEYAVYMAKTQRLIPGVW